jgi:hypothetical protein
VFEDAREVRVRQVFVHGLARERHDELGEGALDGVAEDENQLEVGAERLADAPRDVREHQVIGGRLADGRTAFAVVEEGRVVV